MMSKSRLESFSDGVMAIVITLLALEIKPPTESLTELQAIEFVGRLLPHFIIFIFSFLIIGIMWKNHHLISSKIENTNFKILWANSFLLLFIALVPFATGFLASSPLNKIALVFYSLIMLGCSLAFSIFAGVVKRSSENQGQSLDLYTGSKKKYFIKHKHVGIYSYSLAIICTIFNPLLGYLFIVVPLAFYFYPHRS